MMMEEFNELVNEMMCDDSTFEITEDAYKVIETVYAFHPSISETEGKKQVARLYTDYGFAIFLDMLPRAKAMQNIEYERRKILESLRQLEEEESFVRFDDLIKVNEVLRDF